MAVKKREPDEFLQKFHDDIHTKSQGKLKIFLGYAEGAGKTYAMLQAAHQAKEQGIDVVAGYIETHNSLQIESLLEGVEQLKPKQISFEDKKTFEFDIDAALKRKPDLILIDEYAHTNLDNSRHIKRYQDVQELLNAGINVYTTVNIQHIESLNDVVSAITGVSVKERIPDSVFDKADQVELVDIELTELLERMKGKSVLTENQNSSDFCTLEKLTALREIALRRCADRVNLITENARLQSKSDYHMDEHILVCLSASPSNAKIIRTAARMAQAFHGTFTALFAETPDTTPMAEQDKVQLQKNIRLAQQLGASVETSYGDEVTDQIIEFARLSGVSQIVIGRSTVGKKRIFDKPTLTEKLINGAQNLEIHVIPDTSTGDNYQERKRKLKIDMMPISDIIKSIVVLIISTIIGLGFDALGATETNIVAVYILGVLVISVITTNRLCGFLASAVCVLVFNFFFTTPRLTFMFDDSNYIVTFLIMFIVSLLAGTLTEYVSLYGKEKWALSTYEGNVGLIRNYIEPMIGSVKLSEINTRFMERYYQGLLQTKAVGNPVKGNKKNEYVSASTVREIHKLLRNCFEQAIKWEMIEKNPCTYATVPKHKSQKREIWTAETLMYAMEVCEDERLKLAINLSFSCSLRLGELLGLTWDCVDISPEAIEENRAYVYINKEAQRVTKETLKSLEGKDVLLVFPSQHKNNTTVQILKTPKTESSIRKVFLPKSVANMLVEWKAEQDEVKEVLGEEYIDYNLVMATTFGNPIGAGAIRGQLNKLIEEHNLPPVVFHSLRHSSVTYKLKLNGGDIKAVQGDSGHSQVDMVTDVYSHIIDEDRRRNAELFEEAFYEKKNLDPKMHDETTSQTVDVPDDVDAELLAKVLANPEMKALLASLAKAMK